MKDVFGDTQWFISGVLGFGYPFIYYGAWATRSEAIRAHTKALGKTWKSCRADGDCAVKCRVIRVKKR